MEDLSLLKILISFSLILQLDAERPSIRVVNGKLAKLGQFPFAVAIIRNYGSMIPFCSGTLITPINVLTAAHCFRGSYSSRRLSVLAGETDPLKPSSEKPLSSRQLRKVTSVIKHPRAFEKNGEINQQFDVGILEVSDRQLRYGEFTVNSPLCGRSVQKNSTYCVSGSQKFGGSGGPLIGGYPWQNYHYGIRSICTNRITIYTDVTFNREWIMSKLKYKSKKSSATRTFKLHCFQLLEYGVYGFLLQVILKKSSQLSLF